MRVCYTRDYNLPIPEGHPFPMGKYAALFAILQREGFVKGEEVVEPHEADWADLLLIHAPDYLGVLANGTLDNAAQRRLGFTWTPALLRRSRLAVQGTIDASFMALEHGAAANLAGGTHHAFSTHGEGYCMLNDVAVAIRVLQRSSMIRRTLIIDLDVHQGNGTASIFAGDPRVYTFSIHGQNNYPLRKERSSRDLGLADGTGDQTYAEVLATHLPQAFDDSKPDIVFYLAGVDVACGDRYGRLRLSRDGIGNRDRMVFEEVLRRGAPVVLVLAGGYAKTPEETAGLHAIAHRVSHEIFEAKSPNPQYACLL